MNPIKKKIIGERFLLLFAINFKISFVQDHHVIKKRFPAGASPAA
jgi:hypothetical protein